jgi:hypothetical protein
MTKMFRGHFDGKVLVPEQPVDLPVGKSMEFRVDDTGGVSANRTVADLLLAIRSGPRVTKEDTDELERLIAEHAVPVEPGGVFDETDAV